jgi:CRP/FNR family transcriptional regulator, anaerobic regulatory protein
MEKYFDYLEQFIKRISPRFTSEEWGYLRSGMELQHHKGRDIFIKEGTKNQQLGFVASGLIRGYWINYKGEEITIKFAKEGSYATDYYAFITQSPSRYYFQCLEPTVLVTLSYQHVQNGYDLYPNIERYGRLIAEEALKFQQRRIESLQFDPAEKRYLDFLEENPNLFNRISLTHLSSYLGIERPSLSRIRKKIVGL